MAQDQNRAPRHGRHSSAPSPSAATDAAASYTPETQVNPAPTGDQYLGVGVVSIEDGDQENHMGDAPRPIDVNPAETGSFRRIEANEGARITTRANASDSAQMRALNPESTRSRRLSSAGRPKVEHHDVEVQSNKRVFIALAIAALVVMGIVGTLVIRALTSVEQASEKPVIEQMQTGAGESIEYRGTTYSLEENGGKYALMSKAEGADKQSKVCDLGGKPVALVLYNTAFIIPENLPNGTWDIIAHPLGGGSMTQPVTDGDGNPIVNQGEIESASLNGDKVVVKTTDGKEYTVSLV